MGGWRREQSSPGRDDPGNTSGGVISRHFPEVDLGGVDRRTEVMGFTPDGLPLLGRVPGLPQVYFAVGFGGRGLSWAFVAGERLVDAMLHDADLGLLSTERFEDGGDGSP